MVIYVEKIFCQNCGCEIEGINALIEGDKCPFCNSVVDLATAKQTSIKKEHTVLMRLQCVGSSIFQRRLFIVFTDMVQLLDGNGVLLQQADFSDVQDVKFSGLSAYISIVLKNGGEIKFKTGNTTTNAPAKKIVQQLKELAGIS